MPSNPNSFKPSKEWIISKEQRELALAKRYARQEEVLSEHTKTLPELAVGVQVSVQNQTGNKPKRWERTGVVVEALPYQQYRIRMDGSRDLTLRNRRFLRRITPIQNLISPNPTTISQSKPRRSSRIKSQ